MKMGKKFYSSKTYWFNVIVTLFLAAEANLQLLQPVLGQNVYAIACFVLIVGNAILRNMTKEPIKWVDTSSRF